MTTFVALLRGVNVGGAHPLSSKDFVHALESAGLRDIKTYIQSGNAIFHSDKSAAAMPEMIASELRRALGFAPLVIVLRLDELVAAIKSNPFAEADSNPKGLHLTFLASAPNVPDLTSLETDRADSERYALQGRIFYFWAPDGIARSKAFSRLEKVLGVPGTARNWRTTCKLLELARELGTLPENRRREARKAKS